MHNSKHNKLARAAQKNFSFYFEPRAKHPRVLFWPTN